MDFIVGVIWGAWTAGVSYTVYDYWKLKTSDWSDL